MEERVTAEVFRKTSTAAGVKKERVVMERDSGPRLEARQEEKGKTKVAKVTSECAGAFGKTGHIAANCTKESWNKSLMIHQGGSPRLRPRP